MKSSVCIALFFLFCVTGDVFSSEAPDTDIYSNEYSKRRIEEHQAALNAFSREYMEPIYKVNRERRARGLMNSVTSTDPSTPLLGDIEYEKKLWQRLSTDVVARRGLKAIEAEVLRYENARREFAAEQDIAKQSAGFAKCDEELKRLLPKREELRMADERVRSISSGLDAIDDAKAVRFLAPLMFEDDFEVFFDGDSGRAGFTQSIVQIIRRLQRVGVFPGPLPAVKHGGPPEEEARKMREWWMANREKFGPVYELPPVGTVANPPPEPAKEKAPVPEKLQTPEPSPKPKAIPQEEAQHDREPKNGGHLWAIVALIGGFIVVLLGWMVRKRDRR